MLIMTDHVPDPFIIAKSRQLNKRVTLNVGGVRHEVRQSHQPMMTVQKKLDRFANDNTFMLLSISLAFQYLKFGSCQIDPCR